MTTPGIYLVNASGEMSALATEGGGGDHGLLHEALAEHDVPIDVDDVAAASVLEADGEAVVAVHGENDIDVRIGVSEDEADWFVRAAEEARDVCDNGS